MAFTAIPNVGCIVNSYVRDIIHKFVS